MLSSKTEKDKLINKKNNLEKMMNKKPNIFTLPKNGLIYKKNLLSSIKDIPINTHIFNLTNSFLKNFKMPNLENKKSNPSSTSLSTNSTPLKIPIKENNDSIKDSKNKINDYQYRQLIIKVNELFLKIKKLYLQNYPCFNECILWIENFRNLYFFLIEINKENEYYDSVNCCLLIMFFSIIIIYDIINQNKVKFFMENVKSIINIHYLMSESIYGNSFNNPNINHKEEEKVIMISFQDMNNKIFKIIAHYQRLKLNNFQHFFIIFRKIRNEKIENLYDVFIKKIKNPNHNDNNKNQNYETISDFNININISNSDSNRNINVEKKESNNYEVLNKNKMNNFQNSFNKISNENKNKGNINNLNNNNKIELINKNITNSNNTINTEIINNYNTENTNTLNNEIINKNNTLNNNETINQKNLINTEIIKNYNTINTEIINNYNTEKTEIINNNTLNNETINKNNSLNNETINQKNTLNNETINQKNTFNNETINKNNTLNNETMNNNNNEIDTNIINKNTINTNNSINTNTIISENLTYKQPQIKDSSNITTISGMGTIINNANNYFYFRKPINIQSGISPKYKEIQSPNHSLMSYQYQNNSNYNINTHSISTTSKMNVTTNTVNQSFIHHQYSYQNYYSNITPKYSQKFSNNYYIQNDPRVIIQETIKKPEEESIFSRFRRIKNNRINNYNSVEKDNKNTKKNIELDNNKKKQSHFSQIKNKTNQNNNNTNFNNIITITIDSNTNKNSNQNIGTIDLECLNLNTIQKDQLNYNNNNIPLIPFPPQKPYSLVLDLDETLIHVPKGQNTFILRPGLRDFLHSLIPYYELIVFTTGIKEYADQIINFIEKKEKYFSFRLYRESATFFNEQYYKDLNKLGRDIKKVIIVDDKQINMELQEENGIIIKPFITEEEGGKDDFILYDLIDILTRIAKEKPNDIRESLKLYRNEIYKKISND